MGDVTGQKPGPKRSSSRRHGQKKTTRTVRWCKVRQGLMPVPETLASGINGRYSKPETSHDTTKSTSDAPQLQYRNWTLFLTPDTPKIILSHKRRTESSLTVYPNMTTGNSSSAEQPKIVVHWLERSRAQRIVWLLEELGLEYELKIYKRVEGLAPPELRAIHPLGKSPVVTVDDLVLAESGFIVEYLTTRWDRLRPDPSSQAAIQYQYLLHYAEGSLMPPLIIGEIMQQIRKTPFFIKPIANMIVNGVYNSYLSSTYEGNFRFLETMLDGKEYFAGEFSGADVLLSFPLVEAAKAGVKRFDKETFPNLFAWMDRVTSREGYQRAEARTEKYERRG